MRIGYILPRFPVLSQTFVLNELVELTRQGHEIYIFSLSHVQKENVQPEIEEYNLLERACYPPGFIKLSKHINGSHNHLALLSSQLYGGTKNSMKVLGKVFQATAVSSLAGLVGRLELDVIHAHFYGLASAVAAMVSEKTGIPFTFTCHAMDIFTNTHNTVMRNHMQASERVITISQYNRDYICRLTGIDGSKVSVVRACPILNKFMNVERNDSGDTILTIARLVEKKGIKHGIRALKYLSGDFPSLRYRIVGDGPLMSELRAQVGYEGLRNRVDFLGEMKSDRRLLDEISRASLLLLPCVRTAEGDQDGIPVTLQEAMCARVPVVSTNISGIPELVENGKEGLLVESGDSRALANAIKALMDDCQLRESLGEAARKKIVSDFNISSEVGRLISIWREISEKRSSSQPATSSSVSY